MSWGTYFTAKDIYLIREHYSSIQEVDNTIQELEKIQQSCKETLLMLAMGAKDSVCTKDCEGYNIDKVDAIHLKVKDLLEEYDTLSIRIYNLTLLKENWDTKEQD
jgi:hypothetical protein